MNAEIISVGTELLLGHTINTDAAFVARELSAIGVNLLFACTVGDNPGGCGTRWKKRWAAAMWSLRRAAWAPRTTI